jgi:hypothetical protein
MRKRCPRRRADRSSHGEIRWTPGHGPGSRPEVRSGRVTTLVPGFIRSTTPTAQRASGRESMGDWWGVRWYGGDVSRAPFTRRVNH